MGINAKVIRQMKKQKGKNECLSWEFIKKYLAKCEDDEHVSNVFAMVMYGIVVFSKVLDHIKAAVVDLAKLISKPIQS